MDKTISIARVRQAARDAYDAAKNLSGGANANYIPYLANIDSDLFGLSVTLVDGTSISIGDTSYKFGIESVSKVPTAILESRHMPQQ